MCVILGRYTTAGNTKVNDQIMLESGSLFCNKTKRALYHAERTCDAVPFSSTNKAYAHGYKPVPCFNKS